MRIDAYRAIRNVFGGDWMKGTVTIYYPPSTILRFRQLLV